MSTLETLFRNSPNDATIRGLVSRWVIHPFISAAMPVTEDPNYDRLCITRIHDDPNPSLALDLPSNTLHSALYASYIMSCCVRDMQANCY